MRMCYVTSRSKAFTGSVTLEVLYICFFSAPEKNPCSTLYCSYAITPLAQVSCSVLLVVAEASVPELEEQHGNRSGLEVAYASCDTWCCRLWLKQMSRLCQCRMSCL